MLHVCRYVVLGNAHGSKHDLNLTKINHNYKIYARNILYLKCIRQQYGKCVLIHSTKQHDNYLNRSGREQEPPRPPSVLLRV